MCVDYGLVKVVQKPVPEDRKKWMPYFGYGLPLALFYMLWPGAPLYLLILGLAVLLYLTYETLKEGETVAVSFAFFKYFSGAFFWLALVYLLGDDLLVINRAKF